MFPLTLETPLTALPRVGTRIGKDFERMGVRTVRDLLFHIPFRHEDFSKIVKVADLRIGEQASVRVRVHTVKNTRTPRKGRLLTQGIFEDESGSLKAVWFNQPYLPKILRRGDLIFLSGKLEEGFFESHLTNPVFEKIETGQSSTHAGRLIPIYHTRGALTSRAIRTLVRLALPAAEEIAEWIPQEVLAHNNLLELARAIRQIHFPEGKTALFRSRRRLAFGELFLAQLVSAKARADLDHLAAPAVRFDEAATKTFVSTLPFRLTEDQRRAAWTILQDMERARPMNRLLEGEVGSGKTVVAAMAILNAALSDYGSVLLAPTEILARQHANTLRDLLKGFPARIALLTQSYTELDGKNISRSALEEKIKLGEANLVVGTHALLSERTPRHPNAALLIVDEQHRFGVEQRKKLRLTGSAVPHLLSMTATPIPRTLALTLYGDLDLSQLREMPRGRQPIATTIVRESERKKIWEAVRQELRRGRQAFVICPLISESDKLGVRAATKEFEKLKAVFPEFQLGLLHGKLKSEEKARVMREFGDGKINLLVATAVVEVGIDIPNASIMMIEGAERFGLAQLHQFRGRIGRGVEAARCFLFVDDEAEARERLLAFANTHDGFALAEKDLELRGPGLWFGTEQSGMPRFRAANIDDQELVMLARQEARQIMENDPELVNHPLLQAHIAPFCEKIHLE